VVGTAERGGTGQKPGEFINLYDVLQVPADADTEIIRLQINRMYIEAQQNLDHRNAKKRLRYQQLFQVHLPQARFYLLDHERRQQYDRALSLPQTATDEPSTPEAEVNLAIREELWKQWQDSLIEEEASESSTQNTAPRVQAAASSGVAAMAHSVVNAPVAATTARPTAPVRRSWSPNTSGEDQQRAAEEARRLQLQRLEEQRLRDEKEKKDAQMTMWRNRMIKGFVILVVAGIGLSAFQSQTGMNPLEYVQTAWEKAGEEPQGEKAQQQ
jgi:hypothetical protein